MTCARTGHATMSSALPDAVNYHRWIGDLVCQWIGGGSLLEIGPGYGQYTLRFAAQADRVLAVDLDETCVQHLRTIGGNVEAIVADVEAEPPDPAIGEGAWEDIVCLNVLEHVENDLRVLGNMRLWLTPGGRVVLVLPAHPALYGPMDKMAGHYRRYTARDINAKLSHVGLRGLHWAYINPVGGIGWWINAKFFHPSDLSEHSINGQIRLFDRYVLPISRLCTPFMSRVFGQSLFVVAEKPASE